MTAVSVFPVPPTAVRLSAPVPRAGSVIRERLLQRLDRTPPGSVIAIVGPAGFGKSTVLAQWSERQARFAYLRLDRSDADPARMLGGIAAAIARVEALPGELIHQLDRPSDSLEAALLPRLVEALWAGSDPLVLALDEAEVLHGSPAVDALTWLVTHLPDRARLAIASRVAPPLLLERLAVAGRLVSLGPRDLALAEDEIARLAEMVGRPLRAEDAALVAQRTGGWTAAVRLALDLADPTDITGDATTISAYVREQILAPLDPADRDRLRRVSVLDPLTGPLCDAVLETDGSLAWLRELEQTLPLVSQLGPKRTTFRMHPLLRDVLLDDLQAREPATVLVLRGRAAVAADAEGDIDAAAEYAIASGDLSVLEAIVLRRAVPLFWHGRLATVARWVVPFDRDAVRDRHAAVAILAGWFNALEGRPEAADRWLAIATHSTDTRPMPDGTAGRAPWIAALRSLMMPTGLEQARLDAATAREGLPADSWFRQHAGLAGALVALCDGDLPGATQHAMAAAGSAEAVSATPGKVASLGIAAAAAMEQGRVEEATVLIGRGLEAMREAGLEHYYVSALVLATAARRRAGVGDHHAARGLLARFDRLRPSLGAAFPAFTVLTQLQAMRARLLGDDLAGSRVLLDEAGAVLRSRPDLGWLVGAVDQVQQAVHRARYQRNDTWGLTAAELRVLSLLPTHLSIREMAERVGLSPHTIKTQVVALYGKLGATSRIEALEQGIAAGLLDASVLYRPALLHGPDHEP